MLSIDRVRAGGEGREGGAGREGGRRERGRREEGRRERGRRGGGGGGGGGRAIKTAEGRGADTPELHVCMYLILKLTKPQP